MTKRELQKLALYIVEYIKQDFEEHHLSMNLVDTIKITTTSKGFNIEIPAEMYDIMKYLEEKVIVYNGKGSYASKLNDDGGIRWDKKEHKFVPTGHHIGYIDKAIDEAILKWSQNKKIRIKEQ